MLSTKTQKGNFIELYCCYCGKIFLRIKRGNFRGKHPSKCARGIRPSNTYFCSSKCSRQSNYLSNKKGYDSIESRKFRN